MVSRNGLKKGKQGDADGDVELAEEQDAASESIDPNNFVGILVENAPLAMAMFDHEMRYLVANRRWLKEFRLESLHVLGRSQFDVFPDLHQSWRQIYDRCLQGHIERCEEDIFERADGSRDWVRWEVRPWRKANFSVGGLIITCEVVTALKKAEQALKDDRDLAAALISSNAPTLVLDAAGHITRHSQGALLTAEAKAAGGGVLSGCDFTDAFPLADDLGMSRAEFHDLLLGRDQTPANDAGALISRTKAGDGIRREIAWSVSQNLDEHGVLSQIVLTGVAVSDRSILHGEAPSFAATSPEEPEAAKKSIPSTLGLQAGLAGLKPDEKEEAEVDSESLEGAVPEEESLNEPVSFTPEPPAEPSPELLEELGQVRQQLSRSEEANRSLVNQLEAAKDEISGAKHRADELSGNLLVADEAPFGLLLLDTDGTVIYRNSQIPRVLGHDIDPEAGVESWLRRSCPDSRYANEVVNDWRDRVWRRQLTRVFTLSNSEGLLKEIEFRPSLLDDDSLLIAVLDVTEQRRGEESLRANESRFRQLFADSPVPVALVDSTGYIFEANQAVERLLGFNRPELRKSSLDMFIPATDLGDKRLFIEDMRRRGLQADSIDLHLRRKDGSPVPVRLCIADMLNADEQPQFTAYFILDRREENAVKSELLESQQQNLALLNTTPDAVILIDLDSRRVIDSNQPESFPTHLRLETMRGALLSERLPEVDAKLDELLSATDTLQPDETAPAWPIAVNSEGRETILECRGGMVGDSRAILLARALPTGSSTSRTNSEFGLDDTAIQEINHRIKNNLQILVSLINIQLPGVSDKIARRELQATQERLQSIAFLHEHFHSVDRSLDVNFQPYISRLLEHLVATCGEDGEDSRINISYDIPDSILPMSKAVPLGLVINELTANALKYGFPDQREGIITVVLEGIDSPTATLKVSDNGVGLPDGFDVSAERGLGLKIVGSLARQVGGRLEFAQSETTEFRVVFPMAELDEEHSTSGSE